jgi:hypothetical protein
MGDLVVDRHKPGQHQPGRRAAQGEFVGQDARFQVRERQPHQQCAQEAELQGRERRSQPPDEDEEQHAGQQFDYRIPHGDGRLAMPAAAAQQRVAQQRDVVVPGDRMAAGRAVRAGPHHRKILRQAVDADVEEAADQQAEQQRQAGFQEAGL